MSLLLGLIYLAAGAGAGILAGLFGVGGGMIIVPILILVFTQQGIDPNVLTHMAIATSLATIVFTSLSSVRGHHRAGAIDWSLVLKMTAGIVLGTAIGAVAITEVPGPTLQILIGVFAILLGLKMLLGWQPPGEGSQPQTLGLTSAGSVIGFGSAWFGIGGGTFTVPYLSWIQVPMHRAVATSAACGIPIALTGALTNMVVGWNEPLLPNATTGYVYWPAVVGIVLTSVPFAAIGARLAHQLDAELLKKAFAVLLCIIGIRFIIG